MMHKNFLVLLLLTVCTMAMSAQVKPASKKERSAKAVLVEAVKSVPVEVAKPTGPVGFGPIKIDMTKEELETLTATDSTYLASPLTVKEEKYAKPKEGVIRYDAQLKIPQSPTPIKGMFTFEEGKLRAFIMEVHGITFEFMQKQIAEKYGAGEVKDQQKEEQCIYKNGSNFKLINGDKTVSWHQNISPTEQITTSALDMQMATCPSSLRDPMYSMKTKWIAFERGPIKRESKTNMF